MSNISCNCSVDLGGSGDRCGTFETRRARKEHRCCECGETICIGQKHEHYSGIDADGNPCRYRTCLPCAAIRERYCPDGWMWGFLAETIYDCLGFDYREVPPEDDWDEIDEEDAARVAQERAKRALAGFSS
jgi:hypothetical protein